MPDWAANEDSAVVELYKRLLAAERSGVPLNIKQEILKTPGIDKTAEAVRMRLQNVSAILEEKGLPRLQRLSPLGHYPDQLEDAVDASLPW
jgi:hypothetical protein